MKKTFTFTTNDNNKFFLNNNGTNYSEILDNIIAADIIKKNDYLFTSPIENDFIITGGNLKADDSFIKATKFLANYKTNKTKYNIPIILGKMYTLSDGTPIIFDEDEIQIGFDIYKYNDFGNLNFINSLPSYKKTTIINIFTGGLGNIKINIL
jgi:hypothetical protein